MSTIGKRVIFVGPVDGAQDKPLTVEGVAVTGMLPGTLLEASASGLSVNNNAATVFDGIALIADKNQMRAKSVDAAWTADENMVAIQLRSGEFANVLCVTAQALVANVTPLTRNGAGLLVIAATDGTEEILFVAAETITTSGTELVRVRKA